MKIVELPKPVPNESAIEMLEDWLRIARSGEVVCLAIAGRTAIGAYDTSYFGPPHDLAGPVAYLLHRVNSAIADT